MQKKRLRRWALGAAFSLMLGGVWPAVTRAGDASSTTPGVNPRKVVLDNGLTLLLLERHDQPVVACGVFYDVGGVNDPAGKSGIAHLFEHMLFKGTKIIGTSNYEAERSSIEAQDRLRGKMIEEMNRMRLMKRRGELTDVLDPAQWTPAYKEMKARYDELVEAERNYVKNNEVANLYTTNGGAMMNAGTMSDLTVYFVQLPANKLELFFWIESDRMVNGVMREFYVERDNVREERRLRVESTPTGKYDEAFEALFWQAHPYGVPVLGWASEVESITRQDVRDFYDVYYAPNNARVVVVGDFDTDKVIELAHTYFGRWPGGKEIHEPVITEEPLPIAERRFYAEADTNPRVDLRYHTVAIGHTDEPALEILGGLLSGKTGRLFKRLVTKEEAALGEPFAGNQGRKYAGHFEINVTVKEDRTPEEVETMVLEEIDKLRDGEITDHELQKVKNQVLAASVRRLQNNIWLMFQLGVYDTWYDWSYINDAPQRMLAINTDDVKRVINEYFDPKTRTVAIYRTKSSAPKEPGAAENEGDDPEMIAALETIPPEHRYRARTMIERIAVAEDLTRLKPMLQMMEQGAEAGQVPDDQRPVFDYTLKVLRARVAELEAKTETTNKEPD